MHMEEDWLSFTISSRLISEKIVPGILPFISVICWSFFYIANRFIFEHM